MGLTKTPSEFQRLMGDSLRPVEDTATRYIDEIVAGNMDEKGVKKFDTHEQSLWRFLDVLAEEKLVSVQQCHFFRDRG